MKRIKTEDKTQQAQTSGPNGSISMSRRKIKPILYIEYLIIYEPKKNRAKHWKILEGAPESKKFSTEE